MTTPRPLLRGLLLPLIPTGIATAIVIGFSLPEEPRPIGGYACVAAAIYCSFLGLRAIVGVAVHARIQPAAAEHAPFFAWIGGALAIAFFALAYAQLGLDAPAPAEKVAADEDGEGVVAEGRPDRRAVGERPVDLPREAVVRWNDYLYFSMITWATVGYGDFKPRPAARFTAALEGLLGMLYSAAVIGLILGLLLPAPPSS